MNASSISKPSVYDISPTISDRIGVFPGDTKFERAISLDIVKGDHIGLSALKTTVHLGAHADAPNHYMSNGEGIQERDLERYMGRCLVIYAKAKRGERIGKKHFSPQAQTKFLTQTLPSKILVFSGSFPDPDNWNSDFNSFEPALIESWAKSGVKTIGIDTPSIDPEDSKDLPAHKMVAQHDLSILEGLVLSKVPEGYYTLIALPLKIEGADASPVRAILVDDDGKAFPY